MRSIKHEFIEYIPRGAEYLVIGTFPSVLVKKAFNRLGRNDVQFFYGGATNEFWKLVGDVYGRVFGSGKDRLGNIKRLLDWKKIALTDIVFRCRTAGLSGDSDLEVIEWNKRVEAMIRRKSLRAVYFTGNNARDWTLKFLRDGLRALPPHTAPGTGAREWSMDVFGKRMKFYTLYSPSRRARIAYKEKLKQYKKYLPR